MLHAAEKLTPAHLKWKKRRIYTPDFIEAVKGHLDLSTPLDVAVFACLTTCFYAAAPLGEFTVPCLDAFNPALHVTPKNLNKDQDRQGNELIILHLPHTKVRIEGEDVHWAKQNGATDPVAALDNHRLINNPSAHDHLFAYCHLQQGKPTLRPLTKTKFVERMATAANAAGLEPFAGPWNKDWCNSGIPPLGSEF